MDIIDISQLIFTAVAGIIGTAFSNELATRNHRYYNRGYSFKQPGVVRMFQSRTGMWYGFIFCSLMAITLTFVGLNRDSNEKRTLVAAAKTADSTLAAKMDSVNGAIIRSDTLRSIQMTSFTEQLDKWGLTIKDSMVVKKVANPQADLYNEEPNPHAYRDSQGRYVYKISWRNVGEGIMYGYRTSWWIFFHNFSTGNFLLHDSGKGSYENNSLVRAHNDGWATMIFLDDTSNYRTFNKYGKVYICYQVVYENENGVQQKPFRKIFTFSTDYIEKPQPLVPRAMYNKIDSVMLELGYWNNK